MRDMTYKLHVFHDEIDLYTWFEKQICFLKHKLSQISMHSPKKIDHKKLDDCSYILNEYKVTFFLALRFKIISKNGTPFASLWFYVLSLASSNVYACKRVLIHFTMSTPHASPLAISSIIFSSKVVCFTRGRKTSTSNSSKKVTTWVISCFDNSYALIDDLMKSIVGPIFFLTFITMPPLKTP